MKTKILSLLLAVFTITGFVQPARAQVSVNINIGSQPTWGPTGYDYAENYYLPEVDAYYSVADALFYYLSGGRWISGPSLPYANVDLYNTYKVVVNQPRPWQNAATYRSRYRGYRTRRNQPVIRDSRDQRYFANPQHPRHNEWNGQQPGPRGNNGNRGGGRPSTGGYNNRQNGGAPQQQGGRQQGNGQQGNRQQGGCGQGNGQQQGGRQQGNGQQNNGQQGDRQQQGRQDGGR